MEPSSASGGDGSFFESVNDVLGAVNNFGTTAVTLRERWKRAPAAPGYAVPVAQGSQPGQVAAVNQADAAPFQLSTPLLLVGGGLLLLVVVVAFKLRG